MVFSHSAVQEFGRGYFTQEVYGGEKDQIRPQAVLASLAAEPCHAWAGRAGFQGCQTSLQSRALGVAAEKT